MINNGLLAYTFTKLGDNLTNNDRDILIDISNSTQNIIALPASMPSGLNDDATCMQHRQTYGWTPDRCCTTFRYGGIQRDCV